MASIVLSLGMVGCGLFRTEITVNVINLCTGPDTSVDVYVNDVVRGRVEFRDSFGGIPPGLVRLRAVGTETGGSTFVLERRATSINVTWTLCRAGAHARDDHELAER